MALEPAVTEQFAQYLHHFEVEAAAPLVIGIAVSLAVSGLWLTLVMCYVRYRTKDSTGPAGHQ